jgi:serine protease inhibitor
MSSTDNSSSDRSSNEIKFIYSCDKKESLVLSPYSIKSALAPVFLGSAGTTYEIFNDFFENEKNATIVIESPSVSVSNTLLIRDDVKVLDKYEKYMASLKFNPVKRFSIDDLDNISDDINDIVKTSTKGKISQLIKPGDIDDMAVIVVLNAIHFKSDWKRSFDPTGTYKQMFNGINKFQVDMMTDCNVECMYYEDTDFQAIEKEYIDKDIVMGFVLPKSDNAQFTQQNLTKIRNGLNMTELDTLQIPKFKIESDINMEDSLTDMGLGSIFEICDLSNMVIAATPDAYIRVSKVLHKAVIEVNEVGTEAAATTVGVIVQEASFFSMNDNPSFILDNSFFFYIRHIPTNTYLFIGKFQ